MIVKKKIWYIFECEIVVEKKKYILKLMYLELKIKWWMYVIKKG